MKKEYWHLGASERCAKTITIKPGETLEEAATRSSKITLTKSGETTIDGVFFTDGITIDGHVWVPLESFSKKMEIPRDYMLTDGFLELCSRIHKRDGVFPIQKFDI